MVTDCALRGEQYYQTTGKHLAFLTENPKQNEQRWLHMLKRRWRAKARRRRGGAYLLRRRGSRKGAARLQAAACVRLRQPRCASGPSFAIDPRRRSDSNDEPLKRSGRVGRRAGARPAAWSRAGICGGGRAGCGAETEVIS